jgi:hypothetical protein
VSFFYIISFFFDTNKGLITDIVCNLRDRERVKGGGDSTGPNEARRFVWALGVFFFLSSYFSILTKLLLDIYY